MKIGSLDNQVILYLEGNEDLGNLREVLKQSEIKGVPTKELADMLYEGVNCIPTVGVWQDETDSNQHLVPNHELETYRTMVADWHREWVKGRKEQGGIYGTREQREYAARGSAYSRSGRPQGVDWTKPYSISIPEDIQKEYGLDKLIQK
ncbi:MAG: hypothetical protein ABIB79_02770 [archaeon]